MELDEVMKALGARVERIRGHRPKARFLPGGDPPEVTSILTDLQVDPEIDELAGELDVDRSEVIAEAATALREMGTTHEQRVMDGWERLGEWMLRGYDVIGDHEAFHRLRELDRRYSLIFLISHRSYLDEWAFPGTLTQAGIGACFGFAGANLDFFPLGTVARRTGIVHVRRATTGTPVYRLALRRYVGRLVADGSNMIWSIEGGRSRTGKLRPPRYGLLRYVVDAVEKENSREAMVVPISIVYDQLPGHEVGRMADEVGGGAKRPEDVRWFAGYVRGLRRRLGGIHLDVGEPFGLRERLTELRDSDRAVERIALEVCHRINRATPVTSTAAVCVALLAADRALTLDETVATVHPLARHLDKRGWSVAGGASLTDRATVRRALNDLTASGVLTGYSGGREPVWGVAPQQHLVASVYRNSAVHALLTRGITELALQAVADSEGSGVSLADEALRLRELFKFDFFFADRDAFVAEIEAEASLLSSTSDRPRTAVTPAEAGAVGPTEAAALLAATDLRVAHLTLRPFLEAYAVVADELAVTDPAAAVPDAELQGWCLRVARQQALQGRLASWESVSGEMISTALRLARHRGLLETDDGGLGARRAEFAEEIRRVRAHLSRLSTADDGPQLTGLRSWA